MERSSSVSQRRRIASNALVPDSPIMYAGQSLLPLSASINGSINGSISGSLSGSINGPINGPINGSIIGSLGNQSSISSLHRATLTENKSSVLLPRLPPSPQLQSRPPPIGLCTQVSQIAHDEPLVIPPKSRGRMVPLSKQVKFVSMPTQLEISMFGSRQDSDDDLFVDRKKIIVSDTCFRVHSDGRLDKVKGLRPTSASLHHSYATPISGKITFQLAPNIPRSEEPEPENGHRFSMIMCRYFERKYESLQGIKRCLIIMENLGVVGTFLSYVLPSDCELFLGLTTAATYASTATVRENAKPGLVVNLVELPWEEEEHMHNNTPDILIMSASDFLNEKVPKDNPMRDFENTIKKMCGANTKVIIPRPKDIPDNLQSIFEGLESRFIIQHEFVQDSDFTNRGGFVTTIQRRLTKLPPLKRK
eukprot:TRINITY_DN10368_c0_g1_i1.p1 TRINITY_DN10368_c0_g1~~TRINITY_DN10368_c0_g1_i1.p1  ORF type:complete len:420 (+),score=75.22 TRINITY_DN10368_c0_g1_i1:67-1326(+)